MKVQEKQNKKRKEIALAVRDIMLKSNFEDITVDDICSATGIAKGTFYHYFSGKDCLLDQLLYPIDDYFDALAEDFLNCSCFMEAICLYARNYAIYVTESGVQMARTVILSLINPNNANYISDQRGMVKTLDQIVEHWQKKGELTALYSKQEICHLFLAMLRGYILDWYSRNGSYDLVELLVLHAKLLASGLLPQNANRDPEFFL